MWAHEEHDPAVSIAVPSVGAVSSRANRPHVATHAPRPTTIFRRAAGRTHTKAPRPRGTPTFWTTSVQATSSCATAKTRSAHTRRSDRGSRPAGPNASGEVLADLG
jgi:hypothetical protein